jgi:hypothetical protein
MKAFCIEFYHPVCIEVMKMLHARHDIEPLLCTSSHLHEKAILEAFPAVRFLHGGDAKMGRWPEALIWCEHAPFDAACQHVWDTWHHLIFDMLRRWDYSSDYSQLEMSQDFYEQLIAWNHLLLTLKPDFVFLWEPPHVQYSLMLYALAKYHGIQIICITRTQGAFCLVSDDFTGGTQWSNGLRFAGWEQQSGFRTTAEQLHEELITAIRQATNRSYAEGMPWWQRSYLQFKSGSIDFAFLRKMWRMLRGHLKRDLKRLRKGHDKETHSPVQGIYPHKERGQRVKDSFIGRFAWFRYGLCAVRNYLATMRHENAYRASISTELSSGKKYVLVCFSFQPELTTNPLGGIFMHQWLMANLVAHSVPEDCEVWIKEHPGQFVSLGGTSSYRNKFYYDLIRRLPRVRMVPLHADQFELIDNSIAIATTTGTVGFEALARGKPALIFGDVWYERCIGAWRIHNLNDCRIALANILVNKPGRGIPLELVLKELEITAFRFGSEASLAGSDKKTSHENIVDLIDNVSHLLGLPCSNDPQTINFDVFLAD